jgi:hypothetical protein
MKIVSDIWPSVCVAAMRVTPAAPRYSWEVGRPERNAEQQRGGDEDVERAVADLRERVEAGDAPQRHRLSPARRRRMWQAERVQSQDHARGGRRIDRPGRLLRHAADDGSQHQADEQSRDDPADRPEHPDQRELLLLGLDVVEREAVGEPQRRHVAEIVGEEQQDESGRGRGEARHGKENHAPEQMQRAEHLFSGEVAIGDQT